MNSDNGGKILSGSQDLTTDNPAAGTASAPSTSDVQRRTAAEIARKKVLAAYADKAKNTTSQAVYGGQESASAQQSHLKDIPLDTKISPESWQKYHSAWQDYYQKYYSEYYSNAARDYIAKERLKDAREQAEEDEIVYALTRASRDKNDQKTGLNLTQASALQSSATPVNSAEGAAQAKLRRRIRSRAGDEAKKSRRRRRFIPLLAGLAVVAIILFLQYNRLIFAPLAAYVSPGNAPAQEIEALDPTITQTISADPRLIIPKLNIDVPITFGLQLNDVMEAMNHGVAHYRISGASAYPGEMGNFIITGHSAGDVYSSNPYKYIFSGLERLEEGDLIYVNYNSTRYTYRITQKKVVEPTDVAALVMQADKPLITLVTCTPLGTSRYRLLVTGEQISPIWDENAQNAANADQETPVTVDESTELPSNEPSFFERIWNWLTGQ